VRDVPDADMIEQVFRHKVFRMLLDEDAVTHDLVDDLLAWRHSGFSAYVAGPEKKRQQLGVAEGVRPVLEELLPGTHVFGPVPDRVSLGPCRHRLSPWLERQYYTLGPRGSRPASHLRQSRWSMGTRSPGPSGKAASRLHLLSREKISVTHVDFLESDRIVPWILCSGHPRHSRFVANEAGTLHGTKMPLRNLTYLKSLAGEGGKDDW
jgi:hypothetical protein